MTRNLQSSWADGSVTHAGFGVYKVRARNKPTGRLSGPIESAKEAVAMAPGLGDGYAAFRVVQSSGRHEPRELLSHEDLPINLI
jgi:hypothetical protein